MKTLTIESRAIFGTDFNEVVGLYNGMGLCFNTYRNNITPALNDLLEAWAKPNGFTHYKYNGKRYPVGQLQQVQTLEEFTQSFVDKMKAND